MGDSRLNIPAPIKREVRKRCGFGCIFCGYPIIEYHHILPYVSDGSRDYADNLTLLCRRCHGEYENGHFLGRTIEEANESPHNFLKRSRKSLWLQETNRFEFVSQSVKLIGRQRQKQILPIIISDFVPIIFDIYDGIPSVSISVLDGVGMPVFEMKENEVLSNPFAYDVFWSGHTFVLSLARGVRVLEFSIKDGKLSISRLVVYYNGQIVWASDRYGIVYANGNTIVSGNSVEPIPGQICFLGIGSKFKDKVLTAINIALSDLEYSQVNYNEEGTLPRRTLSKYYNFLSRQALGEEV